MRKWLEAIGLQQYADVLARNDIDLGILRELTEGDLEKLGLSLGHRRRLLKALSSLAAEVPVTAAAIAQEAERRPVTILFCDLIGSTELANAIDPEDMSELLQRYQDLCAGAIARYGGLVGQLLGDGVVAYFGYPQAHEDAAERSVRAALAIVGNIGKVVLPDGRPIQVRIGIATGIVVIGDVIRSGGFREQLAFGDTPNLAARLQTLADPDTILVSASTHRLLGVQFEFRALGGQRLKGFANPVEVWQVVCERAVTSRFAAAHSEASGRYVGREQELGMLLNRWRLASQGQGQALFVIGEAGIGKSRIVEEACSRIADDSHTRILCQCSPYHTNSSLHPLIQYLERAASFDTQDTTATKLEKLEALLAATGKFAESTLGLIADLVSLSRISHEAPDRLPAQHKAATIAALFDMIAQLAERQPVVLVLEDAHWMDPSTRELVTDLVAAIEAMRVFMIVTSRPDPTPWKARELVTSLRLIRLDEAQCAQVVSGIVAARTLAPSLIADIVAKTDGIPLFLEELTKAVMESATPERPAVPATLHDSLMARLDRLGPAKEIAQVAAVIGQQFSRGLLERVVPGSSLQLKDCLERLLEGGLIAPRGRAAEASFSFKHALMRDVAYESLLRARREQLHERIGRALEEHFPAKVDSEPEFLAYHFAQAGIPDRAGALFERAGDRSIDRYAYAEAVAHFRAGLAETRRLPESSQRAERELALLLKLGPALSTMTGPQNPEVDATYRRAHEVAVAQGDQAAIFKAVWGFWFTATMCRRLDESSTRAQELLELGKQSTDPDLLLEAFHCTWSTAIHRGDQRAAFDATREGLARYDPAIHGWMGAVFGGHDPGVCAHATQAAVYGLSGLPQRSRECIERAIALAEFLKHPPTLTQALQTAMVAAQYARDPGEVHRHTKRMLELADRYNLIPQRAHARFHSGWATAFGGDVETGLGVMEAEFPRASNGPLYRYYAALLAEVRAGAGRWADALAVVEAALKTVTDPRVGMYVPELHRLQGECLLRLEPDNSEAGQRAILTAMETARAQSAPLLELRAAVSFVRACTAAIAAPEALRRLRDVIAHLPDEFQAREFEEARRLLPA